MQSELKEKLNNLSSKFGAELDVISLKALCNMPESEEILFAITGTLNRLIEKYPDDEEILELLPKKEKISLEELIKVLEEKYPNNVEVITIKALIALPEGELREKAINQSLERLLEENSDDEDIMEYLEIEEVVSKEQNPDMVFVQGGRYTPSFFREERGVFDLYVSKYQTTQIKWKEIMGTDPSHFKGDRRPVENISWIKALEYCNRLSEFYGLQSVYKIENNKLIAIIHNNGEEVYPDLADFSKTEGYRLPTELEWEWFARGGEVAIQEGTFDFEYSGSNNIDEVAWYKYNSGNETHAVGTKKPNQLGLYDCNGNVWEWCYDTDTEGYLLEERPFIFDESSSAMKVKGGSYDSDDYQIINKSCFIPVIGSVIASAVGLKNFYSYGFRVVRTANPKR